MTDEERAAAEWEAMAEGDSEGDQLGDQLRKAQLSFELRRTRHISGPWRALPALTANSLRNPQQASILCFLTLQSAAPVPRACLQADRRTSRGRRRGPDEAAAPRQPCGEGGAERASPRCSEPKLLRVSAAFVLCSLGQATTP